MSTGPVNATEVSQFSEEDRRRYQRSAVLHNLFPATVGFITIGQLMQLFATDVLHLSAKQIGLILSLVPLNQLFRFLLLNLTRRYGRIHMVAVTSSVRLLVLAAILIIPAGALSFPAYLSLLLIFTYSQGIADVYWQPMLREITSVADRGSFFSRMRFWFQVASSVSIGLITLAIGRQITETQYKLALVLAFGGVANYLFWSFRLPDFRDEGGKSGSYREAWKQLWHVTRHSELLLRPLLINLAFTLSGIPLLAVYQRELLRMPANLITLLAFCATVSSAIGLAFWGRIADRVGFRPMLIGLLILSSLLAPMQLLVAPFSAGPFAWTGLPPRDLLSVAVLLFMGITSAIMGSGIGIGMITLQHFCVRREHALEAMNLMGLISSLCGALVAAWSGYLLSDWVLPAGDRAWFGGIVHVDGIKIYSLTALTALRLASIWLCAGLPNPRPEKRTRDFFAAFFPKR